MILFQWREQLIYLYFRCKPSLENKFTKVGISPPEFLGDHFNYINNYLKDRE
ncbi:MAG: hypothetical protein CM15mP121_2870 [Bacteroidota bacterium]|nr:MAG: hypothetical protein CM15mP121_2870 [Bacteroidota bacterium]